MGEHLVGHGLASLADCGNRSFQIHRVPEHDGGDHKVQPTGAMSLVLMCAISQLPQPVEEDCPSERVLRLALIEPDMDASSQFDAADVLQQEQRPFNLAEFSQRQGQAVLPWVCAKLAQHQRSGDRAVLDRRGEAENFRPTGR